MAKRLVLVIVCVSCCCAIDVANARAQQSGASYGAQMPSPDVYANSYALSSQHENTYLHPASTGGPVPPPTAAEPELDFGEQFGALGGETFAVNLDDGTYIDQAIIRNRLRLRFDTAYDNPFSDRAEFFYPQYAGFNMVGPQFIGGAPGPPLPERRVDYQELEPYLEFAVNHNFSVFVEAPVRFVNPANNGNSAGLSDIKAGFKYALIQDDLHFLTLQLRVYTPTGDGFKGLGTEHVSLEPGVLYQQEYDRLTLFGEFKAWIPIDGSSQFFPPRMAVEDYSGTVLRYGVGAGYDVFRSCCACQSRQLTLVGEVVGWTVMEGLKSRTTGSGMMGMMLAPQSASGDTIVNGKVSVRWNSGPNTIAVGYGNALSGAQWYEDIVRVEYAYRF